MVINQNQNAEFSRVDGVTYIEIKTVGDPCSWMGKATPEFIAQYPREYAAFEAGHKEVDYGGTPLTEIPGFNAQMALSYKLKGIHNCEMLAEASDQAVSSLGLGAIQARKMAGYILKAAEAPEPKRGPGRPRKTQEADA